MRLISREEFLSLITEDLEHGTTMAWPVLRGIADKAYKGNLITEPLSDAAIKGAADVWATVTKMSHEFLAKGQALELED